MVRDTDEVVRLDDGSQQALALGQRNAAKVVAIQVKKIEDEVGDGIRLHSGADIFAVGSDAWLDISKTWPAILVKGDGLTVQDGLLCADGFRQALELGIVLIHGQSRAADNVDFLIVDKSDAANAVPLHFKNPVETFRRV